MPTFRCDACEFQAWQAVTATPRLKHCSRCGASLTAIEPVRGEAPTMVEMDLNEVEERMAVLLPRSRSLFARLLALAESPTDAAIITASFFMEACARLDVSPPQFLEMIQERWPKRETS